MKKYFISYTYIQTGWKEPPIREFENTVITYPDIRTIKDIESIQDTLSSSSMKHTKQLTVLHFIELPEDKPEVATRVDLNMTAEEFEQVHEVMSRYNQEKIDKVKEGWIKG